MLSPGRPASIVIDNCNYARFLGPAIDSALAQTHSPTEVIVVDDGSTDESREVIGRYGRRVVPVFKERGGQRSAINAGFAASQGEVVCFLDADDTLAPSAIEKALVPLGQPGTVKVHWPLASIDGDGRSLRHRFPAGDLPDGHLLGAVARGGPEGYLTSGLCGSAYARSFLEQVFPIEEGHFGTADTYISMLAPLYGRIAAIAEPLASYRLHGGNGYYGRTVERLPLMLRAYEANCLVLGRQLQARGIQPDPEAWIEQSWLHRLDHALQELDVVLPRGSGFVLIDEEKWGVGDVVVGRPRLPFLERHGQYWGLPPDDRTAIHELDRLRRAGIRFVVVAWPSFWWLEHYAGLNHHLATVWRRVAQNDRIIVFNARNG